MLFDSDSEALVVLLVLECVLVFHNRAKDLVLVLVLVLVLNFE